MDAKVAMYEKCALVLCRESVVARMLAELLYHACCFFSLASVRPWVRLLHSAAPSRGLIFASVWRCNDGEACYLTLLTRHEILGSTWSGA